MNRADRVIAEMERGFNCAEGMVHGFREALGIPLEATRLATPFGGGLCRTGQICGLVSGASMVLGWALGRSTPDDQAAKDATVAAVRELIRRADVLRGGVSCACILGVDLQQEEGRAQAEDEDLYRERCRPTAREAVSIVEELLSDAGVLP